MKFEGKVAIVTGAGSGIGRSIAMYFAREGSKVVIAELDVERGKSVADEINSAGGQAIAMKVDTSNSAEVSQLVKSTVEQFGKIDVLVNNAGITLFARAEETTEPDWDKIIDVNLKGYFLCSQAVGKEMIRQKSGNIVNIASINAHLSMRNHAAYSVSKAGVLRLTKALAYEWAKYNINVNAVSPGLTMTPLAEKAIRGNPDVSGKWIKAIPLQRANKPEDIAYAVLFLASPESNNITGQEIIIDGGSSIIHPYTGVELVMASSEHSS